MGVALLEKTWVSLVLGFGSFRQHLVNSSWEAVKVIPLLHQTQLVPSVTSEKPQLAGPLVASASLTGGDKQTCAPGRRFVFVPGL